MKQGTIAENNKVSITDLGKKVLADCRSNLEKILEAKYNDAFLQIL